MNDAISQFKEGIRAAGLEPPDVIEPGKLHRFAGVGKRNGNTAGWCKLFDDGLGGCFGDWSSGFSESWQAKYEKPFSQSERAAFMRRVEETRKHAEAERQQQYVDAAVKGASIWNAATTANGDHPYLTRKGIKVNGARLHQGALVIPVRSSGKLHSLQFIAGATDFNDMAALVGYEAVAKAIDGAVIANQSDNDGWPDSLPLTAKIDPEPTPWMPCRRRYAPPCTDTVSGIQRPGGVVAGCAGPCRCEAGGKAARTYRAISTDCRRFR